MEDDSPWGDVSTRDEPWRGTLPKPKPSNGSNTDETRIRNEKFEQEQTEKTEENADSLFPLSSPVKKSNRRFRGYARMGRSPRSYLSARIRVIRGSVSAPGSSHFRFA
jgi:hypothetical protein